MKNILKFLMLALVLPFFLHSCNNDADRDWTSAAPAFKLYNTTLSSNVLYPTMESNPFRLTWDNNAGGGQPYTVQLATTSDFKTPIVLGTSATNSYSTTIGALNTALLSAGYTPYTAQRVFMRVMSGTYLSNVISFDVTPYPSKAPVITAPVAGTKLVLDASLAEESATTVTWNDYSYGTNVVYTVELAPKGTTNFTKLGTVNNLRMLDVTHLAMDQAVLKLGGKAGVAADYDVRVTATTQSAGGTINSVSNLSTITITPYQLEAYIYALGGFNGWTHDTAEILTSATSNGIYVGYIKFPAAGTEFKITEKKDWSINYGDDGNDGTLDPNGANITSPGAGYYKVTVDLNTKTITLVPEVWGVIGNATPNGWNDPDTSMTWNGANRTWEATLALTAGEIKFRQNNGWTTNYGDSSADGVLDAGGDNIKVAAAGTYKIVFDEKNLSYSIVLQ